MFRDSSPGSTCRFAPGWHSPRSCETDPEVSLPQGPILAAASRWLPANFEGRAIGLRIVGGVFGYFFQGSRNLAPMSMDLPPNPPGDVANSASGLPRRIRLRLAWGRQHPPTEPPAQQKPSAQDQHAKAGVDQQLAHFKRGRHGEPVMIDTIRPTRPVSREGATEHHSQQQVGPPVRRSEIANQAPQGPPPRDGA